MTGGLEITLRDVYDAQQDTGKAVAALAGRLDSLVTGVTARLDSGGVQLADHETRLRSLEQVDVDAIKENREDLKALAGKVESLEKFRWMLLGALILLQAVGAVADYVITHH